MRPIVHVVGARPNFVKLSPVYEQLRDLHQCVIHTGQHYDDNMSSAFFEIFGLPSPNYNLGVGSGRHGEQTGRIMTLLEPLLAELKPSIVVVYGDVNSTLAASLVCAKDCIPIAHVEAGLRSRDMTMPEEINRLVTDRLADLLLTPSRDANENLRAEGVASEKIHFVGNVMVDSLLRFLPLADAAPMEAYPERFGLVTLHRPSNVDNLVHLERLMEHLGRVSERIPLVFPLHPRTKMRIASIQGAPLKGGIILVEPVSYLESIALQRRSAFVITDSGGIQEETTFLGIPCLTLRDSTERPVTMDIGTNKLLGTDVGLIEPEVDEILAGRGKSGQIPELWDGKTAQRISTVLRGRLES